MTPKGDQPEAIRRLVSGLREENRYQTLLGITGSGKTLTVANVIAETGRPALVLAHNKTLAAQLCNEFREFFPDNAVEYFVSYYDYYQPEAYVPTSDTYIEKEAMINQEIDRLRHAATQALLTRRDTIIVASVSCIYGLGAPQLYREKHLHLKKGERYDRSGLLRDLVNIHFERTTSDMKRGSFRARADVVEIMPVNEDIILRLDLPGGKLAGITRLDPVTRHVRSHEPEAWVFPAKHFIISGPELERALAEIRGELAERLDHFNKKGLLLEAERLERRTNFDMAMLREAGYCHGIENYSRALAGHRPGDPPDTLLSYFPKDFLCFIDESHVTLPQLQAMSAGDSARKKTLIDYGFRLPMAADNRPLRIEEFLQRVPQLVFVSATPGVWEREHSTQIVEQVIRPTGLVDPIVTVKPVTPKDGQPGQVDDLMELIEERVKLGERTLVTTLTKKMAEDLSTWLTERKVKAVYLHSDVDTVDRIAILTDLRRGKYDVLVGVNLLREGLDLPEVTLVAILDADKEGFLRSDTSLIQTIGRAARNVKGEVILYADHVTGSIRRALDETNRRREKQVAYNLEHGITPQTIQKAIKDIMLGMRSKDERLKAVLQLEVGPVLAEMTSAEIVAEKDKQMREAAKNLEFELAAMLRDEIRELKRMLAKDGKAKKEIPVPPEASPPGLRNGWARGSGRGGWKRPKKP
jgi:excinuclease ABC subunit B